MAGRSYLKTVSLTESISDCISSAYSEIQSLAEEMGEWRDNMEEKLSHTSKYEQVSEAADALEGVDEPDFDDIGDFTVSFGETQNKSKKRGISRATRLDNAVGRLNACVEVLQEQIDKLEEKGEEDEKEEDSDANERLEALTELRDSLQETIDNLDGNVEFPGMYG